MDKPVRQLRLPTAVTTFFMVFLLVGVYAPAPAAGQVPSLLAEPSDPSPLPAQTPSLPGQEPPPPNQEALLLDLTIVYDGNQSGPGVNRSDGAEVGDVMTNATGAPIVHGSGFAVDLRVDLVDGLGNDHSDLLATETTIVWRVVSAGDECVRLTEPTGRRTTAFVPRGVAASNMTDCRVEAEFLPPVGGLTDPASAVVKLIDRTGIFEVIGPVDQITIVDAPVDGEEVGDMTLAVNASVGLHLVGTDSAGHDLGPAEGRWSVVANGSACGVVDAGPANATTFEATAEAAADLNCRVVAKRGFGASEVSDETGGITVLAGADLTMIVRTAPGGDGEEAGAFDLVAGDTQRLCAAVYDDNMTFLGDLSSDWAVVDEDTEVPSLPLGSFDDATDTPCTTFTALHTGTGRVEATSGDVPPDATGLITVSPGPLVGIGIEELDADGHRVPASNQSISADHDPKAFFGAAVDAFGNRLDDVVATWNITDEIGTIDVAGDGTDPGFDPVTGQSIDFDPINNATGVLSAEADLDDDGEINASRGEVATITITVEAGEVVQLTIEDAPNGAGEEVGNLTLEVTDSGVDLYGIGRDSDGNFVRMVRSDWSVDSSACEVSPTRDTDTTLSAQSEGSCVATAVAVDDPTLTDETGTITVFD